MNRRRIAALVVAALVAGVVAGNVVSGYAANSTAPAAGTTATATMGLRLGGAMRDAGARLSDVVAKLTGMEVEDVQAKREAGTSFAELAATKGIGADTIVDSALDARKTVLADRVKDGTLTQDQADAALDRMQDRLKDRVESTDASCDGSGGGRGGGMGGGRGKGGGGAGCGGTCAAQ